MADWNQIEKLEEQGARKELEEILKAELVAQDGLIKAWDHKDVNELNALLTEAGELTGHSMAAGFRWVSVYYNNNLPLPSEPIPEHLKGRVLAIDKDGNCLVKNFPNTIKHITDV